MPKAINLKKNEFFLLSHSGTVTLGVALLQKEIKDFQEEKSYLRWMVPL